METLFELKKLSQDFDDNIININKFILLSKE